MSSTSSGGKSIPLYPPMNFAFIESGLYRSAYPSELNSTFLDTLTLRTIIALEEDYPSALESFASSRGIKIMIVHNAQIAKLTLSSSPVAEEMVVKSLEYLVHNSNYPVLICCKTGRNLSGTIVACLRKLQRWSLVSILEEFRRFSGSCQQQLEQFIELFDTDLLKISKESPPFLLRTNPLPAVVSTDTTAALDSEILPASGRTATPDLDLFGSNK